MYRTVICQFVYCIVCLADATHRTHGIPQSYPMVQSSQRRKVTLNKNDKTKQFDKTKTTTIKKRKKNIQVSVCCVEPENIIFMNSFNLIFKNVCTQHRSMISTVMV